MWVVLHNTILFSSARRSTSLEVFNSVEANLIWDNLFAHARDSLGIRIFSVYLLIVFRYIPAYVYTDVCGCCCL